MKRRGALSALGGIAATWPFGAGMMPARAQAPGRTYRLGHLSITGPSEGLSRQIVLPELARLGFVEGRNLVFDGRAGARNELPVAMGALLDARPDVVIAVGDAAVAAAAAATRTVPIVVFGANPVQLGHARSFSRPGGNVTGVVIFTGEIDVKRLSILREAVPDRRRVAVLLSTTQQPIIEPALRSAAAGLGVDLLVFSAAAPAEYPAAFAAMRMAGADALLIGAAPEFFRDVRQLAPLALDAGLPTVCEWADMARDGCMIGYGPNRLALRRRMAHQVALIFRGAAPGDVAIELPAAFELALNRTTARALGVTIPVSVLASADEIIE